jgi:hypothetical protein
MSRLRLLGIAALLLSALAGCRHPECALGGYSDAECRVVAESHFARLLSSSGAELRFQRPDADAADGWGALGLLDERTPGLVEARPATLMAFAISIEGGEGMLELVLENVAADAVVSVGPAGAEVDLPAPDLPASSRTIEVELTGELLWIRGRRDCPDRYRILAAGDVQTNPIQFERMGAVPGWQAIPERFQGLGRRSPNGGRVGA